MSFLVCIKSRNTVDKFDYKERATEPRMITSRFTFYTRSYTPNLFLGYKAFCQYLPNK